MLQYKQDRSGKFEIRFLLKSCQFFGFFIIPLRYYAIFVNATYLSFLRPTLIESKSLSYVYYFTQVYYRE